MTSRADRLDYKILHETGQRVIKSYGVTVNKNMEDENLNKNFEELVVEELKISEDIRHFYDMYAIGDLDTEAEVNESLGIISELSTKYRHIHVDLKNNMGDAYNIKHARYDEKLEKITKFVKNARKHLKTLISEASKVKNEEERKVKNEEERLSREDEEKVREDEEKVRKDELESEEEVLKLKITQLGNMVILDLASNVPELVDYISKMEAYISEYFVLYGKFKMYYGKDENSEHAERIDLATSNMSQELKLAKILKQKLIEASEVSSDNLKRSHQTLKAQNLTNEITFRCDSLKVKFERELENMNDYQILEISLDKSLDTEFNEVLEKVTDLAALVSGGGEAVQSILTTATAKRDRVATLKKDFQENLQKILIEKDITPDKLKNATTLQIELPKFSGYNCKIDFFSFKTEFKKLVEPIVQKKYWADYLKRNYLAGSALALVVKENDYFKIWNRLHESYGNTKLMLQNKLSELDNVGGLWKLKGEEKIVDALAGLINAMKDLSSLAAEHKIEGQLYEGGGLEKILILIGNYRHKEFRKQNLGTFDKKAEWEKLLEFLNRELRLRERLALDNKTAQLMGLETKRDKPKSEKKGNENYTSNTNFGDTSKDGLKCHFCGDEGHTFITTSKGRKILPYYVCEKFVKSSATERLTKLKSKNLCIQCLYPGAVRGPKHRCLFLNFCCPHASHKSSEKPHVLLCGAHKNDPSNLNLLEKFKERFITNCKEPIPQCSKSISCFSEAVCVTKTEISENTFGNLKSMPDIAESAIFQLQTIEVDGVTLNLFFDSGCGDMIVRKSAVDKLARVGRARQIARGPLDVTGVGDQKSVCEDGVHSICLPLYDGTNATLTGLCLPKVTSKFPVYDLGAAEEDLRNRCMRSGGQDLVDQLPRLPSKVGNDTDVLIGIKYNRYLPKIVFECDDGFGICESAFTSPCGSRGVLCGPHREFSRIEKKFRGMHASQMAYFHESLSKVRSLSMLSMSLPLVLGEKEVPRMISVDEPICCSILDVIESESEDESCNSPKSSDPLPVEMYAAKRAPKCVRQYDEIERAGTEVTYRCVDCRGCLKCKTGERFDAISIQEEFEQVLIEKSVEVKPDECMTSAGLPFVVDPDSRLNSDEVLNTARKVYRSQVKNLNSNADDKASVIESEAKLQELGFVDQFDNLSDEDKKMILEADVRYFIPWRAVWNGNSSTTPCRLVFDASMGSKGGCSLNSLLATGANGMNKLVEVTTRWFTKKHAFHTDVSKMYNAVKLHKKYWRYQLYLWSDGLDPNVEPVWKVIKTTIYGVRSSGNQAECGLRRTAELSNDEFPEARDAIVEDTYVDDCMSGTEGKKETLRLTDEIQVALAKGGFSLKGFVMSGEDPPEHLSNDKESIMVAGMKWFPRGDYIKLNINELNFSKRIRGKKSARSQGIIPDVLTKRDCVSIVSEIFDISGKIAPLMAGLKLDVSVLHQIGLDWDDPIPSELKNIWATNFEMIKEIGDIRFRRAVIPEDAISLNVETIDTADAGENLICAAIYVRYKLKNGKYSCQLIFARTKIVHDLSIPRAELAAAVLNASTGHIVRLSLKNMLGKSWKFTDSQVALHWINSTKSAMKMWVRNRVVEITRLNDRSSWFYVSSKNMIADLGTRKGAAIADVSPDSSWIQGKPWMREAEEKFPLKTINEIVLSSKERVDANKEKIADEFSTRYLRCLATKYVPLETGERYKFSKYLINPNKYKFSTVIRILGLVFLFIQKINVNKKRFSFLESLSNVSLQISQERGAFIVFPVKSSIVKAKVAVVHLTENLINAAKTYYFRKATAEIKQFIDPVKYKENSVKDGILYYTGRILPSQKIDGQISLSDTCLDLSAASFCVPMTDSLSPVAYAIVLEIHWYDPDVSHGGVESVLRLSQNTAYIIGGRSLVKSIKKSCTKCRILHKKGVRVAMGQIGENNLCIAPPFYRTQVDICGPFSAYSPANKRATLKVWFVVFCCTTTGAVDCRVMENYTTDAFVLSFIRFSSRFGYPKTLMPDEGSQLVKGCQDMVLSFSDIKHRLFVERGVEFKTCPVGAHYVHGKVERKIQTIKRSFMKSINKERLSVLQWETLGQQVANSINNMPIGLQNKCDMLENLDILTTNRLILGRNNNRNPTVPLTVTHDLRRIIENNNVIVSTWFKEWLISYVPTLLDQPKWFVSDRDLRVGDVVLFLKNDKEFDRQYQYGLVITAIMGRDGLIRVVEIEYQNSNEDFKRRTKRGVRDIVVVHPIDEIGIYREMLDLEN